MKNPTSLILWFLVVASTVCSSLWAQQTSPKPQTQTEEKAVIAKPKPKPNPVLAPIEDVEGLPRVLLIGDSISMGYTLDVRRLLAGKANVHRPAANCGPTTTGIKSLERWLSTGGANKKWDVIHFNWGLHDLKYVGEDGSTLVDVNSEGSHQQVPPADYRRNLQTLVQQLKKTNAKLIWRNTTPVPPGAKGRIVGDSDAYNKIAAEIMEAEQVKIHDLYSFALEHQQEIQRQADVHYTKQGSRKLAEEVVKVILEALPVQK